MPGVQKTNRMLDTTAVAEKLRLLGVGRRKMDDALFAADKIPARLGIYDEDEESLCHEVIKSLCTIPGCRFTATSLMDFENHYNASHRYSCGQCKRVLSSPHFLDLHIQETHDSFFSVMAARKSSYSCYIQECSEKFIDTEQRLDHCIKVHKLPKDFRFDNKPKNVNKQKKNKPKKTLNAMDIDAASGEPQKFYFHNSKMKSLPKYSGKKFTSDETRLTASTNMDGIMSDLKNNLPK